MAGKDTKAADVTSAIAEVEDNIVREKRAAKARKKAEAAALERPWERGTFDESVNACIV